METLLAAGADINVSRITDGRNALHVAAINGRERMVGALLSGGADKDGLDGCGDSPLIWAADKGHLPVVVSLLSAGADVNIASTANGRTALHMAVHGGYAGVAHALSSGGADKNALDHYGDTPLTTAVGRGYLSVVKTLIDHGVDMNTGSDDHENKCTPLHWACHREVDDAMLKLLLWSGADETIEDGQGDTPAEKTTCERIRQVLTRASADKAWSRRGWLVMLRSRRSSVWVVGGDAKTRPVKRHRGGGMAATVSNILGLTMLRAWVAGGTGGDADLAAVVEDLFVLELDGVFRNVISFL